MSVNMKDLKFTKDHEWVRVEGEIAIIGISDYAQKELGDVVYVELPLVGDTVEKGDVCSAAQRQVDVGLGRRPREPGVHYDQFGASLVHGLVADDPAVFERK